MENEYETLNHTKWECKYHARWRTTCPTSPSRGPPSIRRGNRRPCSSVRLGFSPPEGSGGKAIILRPLPSLPAFRRKTVLPLRLRVFMPSDGVPDVPRRRPPIDYRLHKRRSA
jgi:hypothetical protein